MTTIPALSATSVAVVGAGRMGRRHMHAVRRSGLKLVGVADSSQASLREAQTEHDLAGDVLFSNQESLCAATVPECLIIATTADTHCALTCAAAESGCKYILVEKPMAVSLDECDLMLAACIRYGARLAVNHQMRFMEQYIEPKRLFESEAYGGLSSMTVIGGNFGFAMNGIHYFEAFRFIAGEFPVEVCAWFSPEIVPNPRGPQFEDRAGCIRATTTSGKRLYMDVGSDQGHGVRVVFAGRNGMVTVNELTGELLASVREGQHRSLPTTRYGMPAEDASRKIRAAEVIDTSAAVLLALLSGEDYVSGEDGRRTIELLVAAYQSAENGGRVVRIDEEMDRSRRFPWA